MGGGVAVFGSPDPFGTERIVLFAENAENDPAKLEMLKSQLLALSLELLGAPVDEVVFGPPNSIPRTNSGKIRHSTCRERYEQGILGTAASAPTERIVPRLRRALERADEIPYAGYAWFCFALWAPIVVLLLALLPTIPSRRAMLGNVARLLMKLSGIPIDAVGMESLEDCRPCVLVANHASYLDVLVLAAILPTRITYTPHREFDGFLTWLLSRLGVHFVDRRDPKAGRRDVERVIEAVRKGESVLFFPEGGYFLEPGLMPFHLGAFVTAAETGTKVLPLGLRGTRRILPPYSWFPHRGKVTITLGKPIVAKSSGWEGAGELRSEAFAEMQRLTEEETAE